MGQSSKIIRGSATLLTADVVSRLISAIQSIGVARYLGQAQLGVLSSAAAVVGMFSVLSDFGIGQAVVQQRARLDRQVTGLLVSALIMVVTQSLFVFLLMLLISSAMPENDFYFVLIIVLGIGGMIGGSGGDSIHKGVLGVAAGLLLGRRQMGRVGAVQVVNRLGLVVGLLVVILFRLDAIGLGVAYTLNSFVTLVLALWFVRDELHRFHPVFWPTRELLRLAWPFGLSAIFVTAYGKAGVLILSYLVSDAQVGAFSAAFSLMRMMFFIPTVVAQSILPYMYQYSTNAPRKLCQMADRYLRWMLVLALPLSVGTYLLSQEINDLVFGEGFDAALPLSILAWFVIFRFSTAPAGYLLTAVGKQNVRTAVQGIAAIANIAVNLILIPYFGGAGAAIAILVSEVLLFLGSYVMAWRHAFRLRVEKVILLPLLATSVMGILVWQLRDTLSVMPVILLAITIYLAILWLGGFVSPRDLVRLISRSDG